MRKVLSTLLALLMVVSCMAGITFSVAAEETTMPLYSGSYVANQAVSVQAGGTYGQVFTVPADKIFTGLKATFSNDGGASATFALYQWKGNHASTVAATPLYTTSFKAPSNTAMTISVEDAASVRASGELYWQVTTTGSTPRIMGATAKADGVVNVINGNYGANCTGWSGAATMYAEAVLADSTAKTYDLFSGNPTHNIGWSTNGSVWSFGQVLTVTEGNAATGLNVKLGGDCNLSIKFSIYRYDAEKGTAVAAATAPLYSTTFMPKANSFNTITFDKPLDGSLYWEITSADGFNGLTKSMVFTYNGAFTETADGAVTGINHVVNGVVGGNFVDWNSASKSLDVQIVLDNAVPAVDTEVELTEKVDLFTGGLANNILFSGDWNVTNFGQKFSVPLNRKLSVWTNKFATANNGAGTVSFYQWNKDYATTVAAAPLYTATITTLGNNNTLRLVIPNTVELTGDLLWVVNANAAGNLIPYGAKGIGEGCIDFVNNGTMTNKCGGGYAFSGWSGAVAHAPSIVLTERKLADGEYVPTTTTTPLFNTVGGSQYNAKDLGPVGQSFIVPAGEILTGVNIRYMCTTGYTGTAKGTFALYQWAGTYAETVSRAPLHTIAVSHSNNAQNITYAIPAELMVEGEVLWVLTPDADSAYGFAPWGAKDQIKDVHSYHNGVEKKLNNFGEYIESTITTQDCGITGALASTATNLFSGKLSYNAAIWSQRDQYTGDGYGQAIKLADGQRLTSLTTNWMYWGGNTTVTVEFFQYQGVALDKATVAADVAATLATEAVFSATITPSHNGNTTINIPSDILLSGLVMWYVRDPFQGGAYTQSVCPGGASGYTDNVLNLSGGRIQGTATGVTGWANAAATDTIGSSITTSDMPIVYINAIDKSVIASGGYTYAKMPTPAKEAFAAKANATANGAWGAWDGTFTYVGNGVYYTNHTYEAEVTVNGETVKAEDKFVTVTTSPAGFVGWKDENGVFVSTSATTKWYPQTATSALTPVYEGTVEAGATANAVSKDGKLTVTVTPTFVSMGVNEYGYYISVGTPIDETNLAGATKVAANDPYAAYLVRVYDLKPATVGQTVYIVAYMRIGGNTVYSAPVTVVA